MFGHTPAGICVVKSCSLQVTISNQLKPGRSLDPLSNDHQRQPVNSLYGKIIDQLYNCTFHVKIIELNTILLLRGRNRAVGVVTGYGLEIPGIESRCGGGCEIFRTRPNLPWGPSILLYNGYRISLPGVERLGGGVAHPSHLAPMLKKE